MRSDLVDVEVCVHAQTDKAVLVSDDGDRVGAVWLPKSQIEIERKSHAVAVITLPVWLATEKELV